jgi:hypothetical protein
MPPDHQPGVVDLLAAVLREAPALPGALCRDRWELWDGADEYGAHRAMQICGRCPDLRPCRSWLDAQKRDAVTGVVAGQLVPHSSTAAGRRPT